MTTDQLKKLKENDLRRFSYTKTMDVVETLESLNLIDISGIAAHEEIETYISLTAIIKNRVDHDELQKQPKLLNRKSKDRDKDKDILRNRLINILANLRFAYNFVRLNSRIDTVEKISDNIQGIREDFNNLQKDYEDKKKTVDNIIDKHREELNSSERAIMSHVLSIMGVFSAVITLIMSLVITTSSWLNNADQSDAFYAFVVPNGVTLVAVFSLVLLVYFFIDQDKIANENERTNQKKTRIIVVCIILGMIVLFCALLSLIFINTSSTHNSEHTRYIIQSEQYKIINQSNNCTHDMSCDCDNGVGTANNIEFTFAGNNYSFNYDEALLHDGNLYFCAEHGVLE